MDSQTLLAIALLIVHSLSFATLLGALVHARFFVTPVLRNDPDGPRKFLEMSARGAIWIHAAIALSLLSGLVQYATRAQLINHPLVGTKILLALAGFAFVSMVFRRKGEPRAIAAVEKRATIALVLFALTIVLAAVATK